MNNLPDYVEKIRVGFTIKEMRADELHATKLAVLGMLLAVVVSAAIIYLEYRQHQYLDEIIRGALRDYFSWLDTWR